MARRKQEPEPAPTKPSRSRRTVEPAPAATTSKSPKA